MESKPIYLNTAPLTIVALGALVWAIGGLVFASIGPHELVPRVFSNVHIEHFAALYIVTALAALGLPMIKVARIAIFFAGLAMVLELYRMTTPTHRLSSAEDLFCDLAGIAALVAPILIGRMRDNFRRPSVEVSS